MDTLPACRTPDAAERSGFPSGANAMGSTMRTLAMASLLVACAPTHESSLVVETSPVRLGSEWAGPPTHRAAVGVLGSTATVSVTSTRACRVSERLDEVHEDREQRGISLGLMIPGGILAAVGVSMLADPGPSCADHQRKCEAEQQNSGGEWGICPPCVYDERQANETFGSLLLVTGAALALGGVLTAKDERRIRRVPGTPMARTIPGCASRPAAGMNLRFVLDDGSERAAITDAAGRAELVIEDAVWDAHGGVLRGALYVGDQGAQPVELVRSGPRPK